MIPNILSLPRSVAAIGERPPILDRDASGYFEKQLNEALSLKRLSERTDLMGDIAGSLAAMEKSVGILRDLSAKEPTFTSLYAEAVATLARQQIDVGMKEALTTMHTAVEIHRTLVKAHPEELAEKSFLAAALIKLSFAFAFVGRIGAASAPAQEAVKVSRKLAAQDPQKFAPDLAESLINLAIHIQPKGTERAARLAQESVDIFRSLAETDPSAYRHRLADTLFNLSSILGDVPGRDQEALAAIEEAVVIHKALAIDSAEPVNYYGDLMLSLSMFSNHLQRVGRLEDSLSVLQEMVALYKEQSEYNTEFAESAEKLSLRLGAPGTSRRDVLITIKEIVEIYKPLIKENAKRYRPQLVQALNTLKDFLKDGRS